MTKEEIRQYVADTFEGVDVVRPEASDGPEIAWGDTFFIYDPGRDLKPKHCFPFATIVTKDYDGFDEASNLNRPDVFRLNIGVGKETCRALFGQTSEAESQTTARDYSVTDQLLPHPIYSRQSWVCVLNPTEKTFRQSIVPLLAEAYQIARSRTDKMRSSIPPAS